MALTRLGVANQEGGQSFPHRHPMNIAAPPEPNEEAGHLKSLAKVVDILDCFSSTVRELSVTEIARRCSMPKSTAHRIVDSMRRSGLLEQDATRDRYRLGIKLFEYGSVFLSNMDLQRVAGPFMDALTKRAGESGHLQRKPHAPGEENCPIEQQHQRHDYDGGIRLLLVERRQGSSGVSERCGRSADHRCRPCAIHAQHDHSPRSAAKGFGPSARTWLRSRRLRGRGRPTLCRCTDSQCQRTSDRGNQPDGPRPAHDARASSRSGPACDGSRRVYFGSAGFCLDQLEQHGAIALPLCALSTLKQKKLQGERCLGWNRDRRRDQPSRSAPMFARSVIPRDHAARDLLVQSSQIKRQLARIVTMVPPVGLETTLP
jgi:predicted transcriptional regulator